MPHLRLNSTSVIARIMDSIVGEYDTDLMLNPCEVENINCRLASGYETAFVSLTIHHLAKYYQANGFDPDFQRIFYIPSLVAENTGGFDLSIGSFNHRQRVRTMHKVLYGIKPNRWCDESWTWKIKNTRSRNGDPWGDYRHLGKLIQNYRNSDWVFRPFLVLHVCYCVHEYRRMGMVYNGICVPEFISPLRTIIIDIGEIGHIFNQEEWADVYRSRDFNLLVSKRIPEAIPDESRQDNLSRSARPEMYDVYLFADGHQQQIPVHSAEQFFALTMNLIDG